MNQFLRLPCIPDGSASQKTEALKSYLCQTVSQLNRILQDLSAPQSQWEAGTAFSQMLPMILSSGELARVMGEKLEKQFLPRKGLTVLTLTADGEGKAAFQSNFSSFAPNRAGRQVFFLAGSREGMPVQQTMVLLADGTLNHQNQLSATVDDKGKITLSAAAGDRFLIVTHRED